MKSIYRIGIEQLAENKWLTWVEFHGDKLNIRRKVTESAKDAIQALNDIYKAEYEQT